MTRNYDVIDMGFDVPFRIVNGEPVRLGDDAPWTPEGVEFNRGGDILIDGVVLEERGQWEALTGYSGQWGYDGPIMHASEFLGGGMAADIREDEGGIYVLKIVDDDSDCDCGDCDPVGWIVLRAKVAA